MDSANLVTEDEQASVTMRLEKPVHGGYCLAHSGGGTWLVQGGLPTELVEVKLVSRKKKLSFGQVSSVIEASKDRVEHIWPEASMGRIGGAELGQVALPAQYEWKRQVLTESLEHIGSAALREQAGAVTVRPAPADNSNGLGQRTRVELSATKDCLAGMCAPHSHEVRAVQSLPLATKSIQELGLLGQDSRWSNMLRQAGRLRAIDCADGPVVWDGRRAFDERLRQRKRLIKQEVALASRRWEYEVDAGGFWQAHRLAPGLLAQRVLSLLGLNLEQGPGEGSGKVWELFSGSGLLSAPVSQALGTSGQLLCVEGNARAARNGRKNVDRLSDYAKNTRYLHGRISAKELASLADGSFAPEVVILDPPRAGAGTAVMMSLADLCEQTIVYIACDPAALARDLAIALDRGWKLEHLEAWDFFAHTHHFESIALLRRI